MSQQKKALIFFTKVPTPGLTKTRLTKEHGGIFTPEEAAEFYRAVMLDTAEVGFRALEQLQTAANDAEQDVTYDFVISATPEHDHPRLKEIFAEIDHSRISLKVIADQGRNFNEHFNDAFRQLWALGYEAAVAVGGDQPQMTTANITEAFQWLDQFQQSHQKGLVHCPCQACGVSLIGLTKDTPMDFEGVFYNTDGISALDAIITICDAKEIPVAALATVADIDNVEDLAHALSLAHSQSYTARFQSEVVVPQRFIDWAKESGLTVTTPPNDNHDPRELIDA